MIKIRPATQADIPVICKLGAIMHDESRFAHFNYSSFKVAAMFARLIAGLGCAFVAEKDGVVIGGIAGYLDQNWYGTNLVATELVHFIAPEHRGSTAPVRLVKAFIAWGKKIGAEQIQIGVISGVQQERTEKFYERLGGERIGTLFKFGGV